MLDNWGIISKPLTDLRASFTVLLGLQMQVLLVIYLSMKKFIIASALALALPALSMAATISNVTFDNNQTQTTTSGGSTVNARFRITIPAGEVVECVETDLVTDNLPASLPLWVGGDLGLQEGVHDVTVGVSTSPNTGTYSLNVKTAGIFGGNKAITCSDPGAVISTASFPNAVRVVSVSPAGSPTPSTDPVVTTLLAQIDALTKLVKQLQDQLAGVGSAKSCPPAGPTSVTQQWLLDHGYSAGFHAAGVYSPTGFWGSITAAAYAQASAACHS